MKAAILVLFLLVQGIVGLPWQLPDKDDPNRCSYPAVFLPYESRQCGIAKGGHGWLSFPVRVCSDKGFPSRMCHVSNTNPRCCKSDFSKAKEAPGDKYVSVGDTKIKIDFYEVDFFTTCFVFPEGNIPACKSVQPAKCCKHPRTKSTSKYWFLPKLLSLVDEMD